MPRQEGQKAKLLVLLHIFERKSDENHLLSVPQLAELLEKEGVPAERKSIYADIAALQEAGGKLSRNMIDDGYEAFSDVVTLVIELIRQF